MSGKVERWEWRGAPVRITLAADGGTMELSLCVREYNRLATRLEAEQAKVEALRELLHHADQCIYCGDFSYLECGVAAEFVAKCRSLGALEEK